ncbi:geranylgeranylglyceryl/heptaprenylglyceryl phosphate synthase [Candidatus Micrarchaeota archaeon]|nr:geranylgeranylglyceryl/heptaprenylglyceryl phosphate synthase [Candidatus Micrarchaeota archaeon]
MGKVEEYILEKIDNKEKMLFSLIDPDDYKSLDDAVKTAVACNEGGSDIILIGGSIAVQGEELDQVAKEIKNKISVPMILFPGNISTITKYADAIYFMSLLNSRNPYWIQQAQTLGAPVIRKYNIEPLPVGYIVVEPGGTVGWVGDVNMVPRNKPKIAASLALGAQYAGSRLILTDAGSNPHDHIPVEMVSAIAKTISVPYVVGGGIRTVDDVKEITGAGADAVQIGTAFENSDPEKVKKKVEEFKKVLKFV